eukprot:g3145.t1
MKSQPIIGGAMPIGNGEFVANVFSLDKEINQTADFKLSKGIHFWLQMTTAMASDTTLFPLGIVSIATEPSLNLSSEGGYRQVLFMENATVVFSTNVGMAIVWIDANTNKLTVRVMKYDGKPFQQVNITKMSFRPNGKGTFHYQERCFISTSEPDISHDDVGEAILGLSHRNSDTDKAFDNKSSYFNTTLTQQGLGKYVGKLYHANVWRRRQFGFVATADKAFALRKKNNKGENQLQMQTPQSSFQLTISALSEQVNSSADWFAHVKQLHRNHVTQSHKNHQTFWSNFWEKSHIWVSSSRNATINRTLEILTARYAQTRYLQAIQAGTWVPIKFNGQLFTTQLPPETSGSGPTYRDWGSSNWWQNTRLAYWNMHFAGDFKQMRTIFQYYLAMVDILQTRTMAAFNHTGIYTTETKTLFGLYDPCDYGTSSDQRKKDDLNFGYEDSRWLKFDLGGDAGLTEVCMMLLDYFQFTKNEDDLRLFLPLLSGTLDFFSLHYGDVAKLSSDETLTIFPTQALETYQCPEYPPNTTNCPSNDAPTVSALLTLTERALQLPKSLVSSEQRTKWLTLQNHLPTIPFTSEEYTNENGETMTAKIVSPYDTYPNAQHVSNVETPELYSTHPFRYFTLGRSLLNKSDPGYRDIAPSLFCLLNSTRQTCRYADSNTGWTQGVLNAALLGAARKAAAMVTERALVKPATGYNFPTFSQHYQDYEPSEDHFANMNTALQLMLIQSRDDGSDGVFLFPAFPCSWDVDFVLHGPSNAVLTGKFAEGKLVDLHVQPESYRSKVTILECQQI